MRNQRLQLILDRVFTEPGSRVRTRVLFFIREDEISSKREGGEWGVNHIPSEYRDLIHIYLNKYNGKSVYRKVEHCQLSKFAVYIIETIKQNLT
ncbi:aminoglycoside adenylyltransferase domain-containing protein [Paenibacillus sp.]|uniref:aminoglycoside adenylyltransferase domain-containing protein n=1 Tax=Paenibacillus sp. TaxID=58172 RepID=UPI0037C8E658